MNSLTDKLTETYNECVKTNALLVERERQLNARQRELELKEEDLGIIARGLKEEAHMLDMRKSIKEEQEYSEYLKKEAMDERKQLQVERTALAISKKDHSEKVKLDKEEFAYLNMHLEKAKRQLELDRKYFREQIIEEFKINTAKRIEDEIRESIIKKKEI